MERFISTLYKLVHDVNRYVPSKNLTTILDKYKELNFATVVYKIGTLLKNNVQMINDKNQELFNDTFIVLPNFDLKPLWPKLKTGQKNKVWIYLSILQIESDLIITQASNEKVTVKEETVKEENVKINDDNDLIKFDPFEGIGSNDTNVAELYESISLMDEEEGGPGIESVMKMLGVDKMIDIKGITEQIRTMTPESIKENMDKLQEVLGDDMDKDTYEIVETMLFGMNKGLQNQDNLIKALEETSKTMEPIMKEKKFDPQKLIKAASAAMETQKNPDGSSIPNPMAMLSNFFNPGTSKKQMLQQAQNMLGQMGMGNVDMSKIVGGAQKKQPRPGPRKGRR